MGYQELRNMDTESFRLFYPYNRHHAYRTDRVHPSLREDPANRQNHKHGIALFGPSGTGGVGRSIPTTPTVSQYLDEVDTQSYPRLGRVWDHDSWLQARSAEALERDAALPCCHLMSQRQRERLADDFDAQRKALVDE